MGVAAYNRSSAVVRQMINDQQRPVEFRLMDELNAIPKYEDAGVPFGPIRFVHSHGGWWAECPVTGFGYWYRTLREAMRRWHVVIHTYEHGAWLAEPSKGYTL